MRHRHNRRQRSAEIQNLRCPRGIHARPLLWYGIPHLAPDIYDGLRDIPQGKVCSEGFDEACIVEAVGEEILFVVVVVVVLCFRGGV